MKRKFEQHQLQLIQQFQEELESLRYHHRITKKEYKEHCSQNVLEEFERAMKAKFDSLLISLNLNANQFYLKKQSLEKDKK
jgi:hypothetical protein